MVERHKDLPASVELTMEEARLYWQAHLTSNSDRVLLQRCLSPGMKVLDVGCGPGFHAHLLAELVSSEKTTGSVVCLDIDPLMLQKARQITDRHASDQNPYLRSLNFIVGDVYKIGMESDSVDVVFCRFVLEHLKEPQKAVREMVRVTKPGGAVIVIDTDDRGWALTPRSIPFETLLRAFENLQLREGGNRFVGQDIGQLLDVTDLRNVTVSTHQFDLNSEWISRVIMPIFYIEQEKMAEYDLLTRAESANCLSELQCHLATRCPNLSLTLFYGVGTKPK